MLCQPGGPEDCGLVYLVMTDPELRADLLRRSCVAQEARNGPARRP